MTGEVLGQYMSQSASAKALSLHTAGISAVLKGKQKSCGGFFWRMVGSQTPLPGRKCTKKKRKHEGTEDSDEDVDDDDGGENGEKAEEEEEEDDNEEEEDSPSAQDYVVDRLLDVRQLAASGQCEFLVAWRDYSARGLVGACLCSELSRSAGGVPGQPRTRAGIWPSCSRGGGRRAEAEANQVILGTCLQRATYLYR